MVGHTDLPLDHRNALESSVNDYFTEVLHTSTGTQIALSPGFHFDSPVPAPNILLEDNTVATGAITLEDIYRYFPVVYTLATATTDGANLCAPLESALTKVYSPDTFKQGGGWVTGVSGIHAEIDLSRPDGQRVLSLAHSNGSPILDDESYSVTGCRRPIDQADTLCSYLGLTNIEPFINPDAGVAYTVADLFAQIHANGYAPATPRSDLHDVSDIAVWPATHFVQPLP